MEELLSMEEDRAEELETDDIGVQPATNSALYFSTILCKQPNRQLQQLKQHFLQELHAVERHVMAAVSEEVLSAGLRHVRSALSVMKAVETNNPTTSTPTPKRHVPPNTNVEHQASFFPHANGEHQQQHLFTSHPWKKL